MRSLTLIITLLLSVLIIVGWWRMFEKADEAGWKSIIPFLNSYIIFKMAGRNGWGILLLLIPVVNLVVSIMISVDLAKHFGKSGVYGFFCLFLIPFIGALDLGFGEAKYVGPKHA